MERKENIMSKTTYNSDINTIGGIGNYEIIHLALKIASDGDFRELQKALVENNEFSLRTEHSRKRVLAGVQSSILQFKNEEHRALVKALFATDGLMQTKQFVIFWQMALNNDLFSDITKDLFLKLYFSGRAYFPKDEIIAYILHLQEKHPELKKWSSGTISTLSSKYLTLMKKLDLLKGGQKKEFNHIQVETTTFIFFIYLMKAVFPNTTSIYETGFFEYVLMSKETFMKRAKRVANLHYYDFSYNGVELQLIPTYKPKELLHVLLERTSAKI